MEKAIEKLNKLRTDLFEEIKNELAKVGHCKPYEGEFVIVFPDYFEQENWTLELNCYVVGPNRHYQWSGKTLLEAVEKAETEVRSWFKPIQSVEYLGW